MMTEIYNPQYTEAIKAIKSSDYNGRYRGILPNAEDLKNILDEENK